MERTYRILQVEDMPSDAFLVQRDLKKFLGSCLFECVETKEDFLTSLTEFRPDIILSDYSIPGFDWLTAFRLTREHAPHVPFIILTGSMDPSIAADCKKTGVLDFINKDQRDKLGPLIRDALGKGS
jgi:CheY-like chemotaxis protein